MLITEHVAKGKDHTTFYLGCGPDEGPVIIFVHGWPELSISWRYQLRSFGALGFRAVAPDMRGYGRSTNHAKYEDYSVEHAVYDMLALLDSLGRKQAVWVGHDWGSPVVWSLASLYPQCRLAVANLCVPYIPLGFSPDTLVPLVDRRIYPEEKFPAGQWDYQLFYQESFERACAIFEADVGNTIRALFRREGPSGIGKPAATATIRRDGGWFGGAGQAPDLPIDSSILSESDYHAYVAAFERTGFFGPDSWYMNAQRNVEYAARAPNDGRLSLPVLFLHGAYDAVCRTVSSRLADPMRHACRDPTEAIIDSGHWMAQERPAQVNRALCKFVADKSPNLFLSDQ